MDININWQVLLKKRSNKHEEYPISLKTRTPLENILLCTRGRDDFEKTMR